MLLYSDLEINEYSSPVNIIPPLASPNRAFKTISIRSTIESTSYDVSYYVKFNILSRDCLSPLLSIWFEDTDFGGTNDTNSKYLSVYHNGSLITDCGNSTNTCGDTKWCLQDYNIMNMSGSIIAEDSQFVILLKKGWNSSIPSGACQYSLNAVVTLSCTGSPTNAPTSEPTTIPTNEPTLEPTINPTTKPTMEPTYDPTFGPTSNPNANPTTPAPILNANRIPTNKPTAEGLASSPNSTTGNANDSMIDSSSNALSIILGVIGGALACACIIVGLICFRHIHKLKLQVAEFEVAKSTTSLSPNDSPKDEFNMPDKQLMSDSEMANDEDVEEASDASDMYVHGDRNDGHTGDKLQETGGDDHGKGEEDNEDLYEHEQVTKTPDGDYNQQQTAGNEQNQDIDK